jgi:hypothetical protein
VVQSLHPELPSKQGVSTHFSTHLLVFAQVGGGGQSLVLQPFLVQLTIWQNSVFLQAGHSVQVVTLLSLQFEPEHLLVIVAAVHLP